MDPRASHDNDPRNSDDNLKGNNGVLVGGSGSGSEDGDGSDHHELEAGDQEAMEPPGGLPDDLPKSLDDRRSVPVFPQETEIYDAWQGMSIAFFYSSLFFYMWPFWGGR